MFSPALFLLFLYICLIKMFYFIKQIFMFLVTCINAVYKREVQLLKVKKKKSYPNKFAKTEEIWREENTCSGILYVYCSATHLPLQQCFGTYAFFTYNKSVLICCLAWLARDMIVTRARWKILIRIILPVLCAKSTDVKT